MDNHLQFLIDDLKGEQEFLLELVDNFYMEILGLEENIKGDNIKKAQENIEELKNILANIQGECNWGEKFIEDEFDNKDFEEKMLKGSI